MALRRERFYRWWRSAYKGFALGLIVEIFAGALSGGVCIREEPINQNGNCVYLQVINPAALGGAEHFAEQVRDLLVFIRDCPRINGVDRILLPGDPEREVLAKRTQSGISFDDGNWNQLVQLAQKLNVPSPI